MTWLAVAFFLSRLLTYSAGVVFYGSFIHRFWQSVDLELLRTNFLESIYYSHAQPPLFNVLNGILVKIFSHHYTLAFRLINLGLSFATALLLYDSLRRLRLDRRIAAAVALFYILNPAVMLYENLYSYTIMTAFLVTGVAWSLTGFLLSHRTFFWTSLMVMITALVLTRSSFHLLWMIGFIVLVLAVLPEARQRKLIFLAGMLVIVASSWYVKNLVVFGTFSASSWLGMSMARVIPPGSALDKAGPFKPLDQYKGLYSPVPGMDEVSVLNLPVKTHYGYTNFYHKDYLAISGMFSDDVFRAIRQNPSRYLGKVVAGLSIFFSPATHAPFTDRNYHVIERYASILALDFSGFRNYTAMKRGGDDLAATREFMQANRLGITYAVPALVVYSLMLVLVTVSWRKDRLLPSEKTLVALLLLLFAYGMLVGILFEFGENNRFRFEMQSVIFILLPFTASRAWSHPAEMPPVFKVVK